MNYFRYQGHTLASEEALPYEPLAALPGEGEVLWCFRPYYPPFALQLNANVLHQAAI